MWYPPATEVKAFPTAALSTSGTGNGEKASTAVSFISVSLWVEVDSFLSACQNKLPCIFSCKIKTGETNAVPPVKNPCV